MLISKADSFITSLHCHELLRWMQILGVLCLRHAVVFLCSLPRKLLGPTLCVSSVCWWYSYTEISDVPCTGEVVSLSPRKLETVCTFLECIIAKSFDNSTFLEKTLKFAKLHVHVSSTHKSIRSHSSWFRLFKQQCFFVFFQSQHFFQPCWQGLHVLQYFYHILHKQWNCVLTCAQGPSWGTKLSLVQTQVPCTSQCHDVRQELSTQWLWMLMIFLFPDSKIIH